MIVGTAGHVDHGKTTLVRALTGIDTDRLAEEKARGISIELGYAYVAVESAGEGDPVLGFVDVPGHERFVHTMVAGAGGIDFALLVVAADDGVMPQTREHLAILDLLGVTDGAVAIAKTDRVDAARVAAVAADVRVLLAGSPLREAPLFALVATRADDAGVAALRGHLHARAAQSARRDAQGLFRLAVDRVFTLAGHGTVVTGIVHGGEVRPGDTPQLLPAGIEVRVRGLHAQNREAGVGRAGQRCALNLAGIDKDAIARGDWIADPRAARPSKHVDVRLRLLAGSGTPLRQWTPVHVHLGSAHHPAHVVLLEGEQLPAGADALVQLVFDRPGCAAAGDRFVLRDARAAQTLGGGRVLDPQAPERRRRSAARLAWLAAIERLLSGDGIAPLLAEAPYGLALDDLVALCGRPPERIALGDALRIDTRAGVQLFAATRWQVLRERILAALDDFHATFADEPGIDSGRLRRRVAPTLNDAVWRAVAESLVDEGQLLRRGSWLLRPGHRVEPDAEERALLERLQPILVAGRFDPPWVRDLAVQIGVDEERVRRVVRKAAALGELHQVVRDLFYARECIDELARIVRVLAADGPLEAARLRDAIGLGRKRTIQLLEYFDRVGYTRRVRDAHILRGDGYGSA